MHNDGSNDGDGRMRRFVEDCRDNWDHDQDAHTHGTPCRVCEAEKLVGKKLETWEP